MQRFQIEILNRYQPKIQGIAKLYLRGRSYTFFKKKLKLFLKLIMAKTCHNKDYGTEC